MRPRTRGKQIRLERGEQIVAVVCENASGPGWHNQPTKVLIVNYYERGEQMRVEWLQPDEISDSLCVLFPLAAKMHEQLVAALNVKRYGDGAEVVE